MDFKDIIDSLTIFNTLAIIVAGIWKIREEGQAKKLRIEDEHSALLSQCFTDFENILPDKNDNTISELTAFYTSEGLRRREILLAAGRAITIKGMIQSTPRAHRIKDVIDATITEVLEKK
jgi:hypothetical protein